ncbi:MAG: lysostaphin resistance A-like protein [Acidimicrobiales bacterium]
MGILISVLFASIAAGVSGFTVGKGKPIPVGVTAADLVGLWVGLVGAVVIASQWRGTHSLGADFGARVGGWLDIVGGGLIGVACQFGLLPLLYLPFEAMDKSLSHQLSNPAHTDTGAVHSVGGAIVLVVFLALGAPIVEELFFRGLLLRALLYRLPVPAAIAISALAFGLAHFEAVQFAGLAVFGAVLGWLAWRTARLAPGMAAHAAFNASAVIATVHLR